MSLVRGPKHFAFGYYWYDLKRLRAEDVFDFDIIDGDYDGSCSMSVWRLDSCLHSDGVLARLCAYILSQRSPLTFELHQDAVVIPSDPLARVFVPLA